MKFFTKLFKKKQEKVFCHDCGKTIPAHNFMCPTENLLVFEDMECFRDALIEIKNGAEPVSIFIKTPANPKGGLSYTPGMTAQDMKKIAKSALDQRAAL